MRIEILGTESLGVHGLSCVVEVENRKIVIDPGLALGYRRHGLLPHPAQVAVGEQVRQRILAELRDATDVVMSHFHGDHVPLPDANPYQLKAQQAAPLCRTAQLWAKGPQGLSDSMLRRRESLGKVLDRSLPNAEGQRDRLLAFSLPVPHGRSHTKLGTVMMTRIAWGDTVFVHASDIQLLDGEADGSPRHQATFPAGDRLRGGGGSLLYALAPDWRLLVAAAILAAVATSLSGTGCRVICADSVQSKDRVTAQNVCSTMASIARVISPLVSAYLVTVFGGMTVEGIRPLYYLQFAGYGLIFLLVVAQLREPRRERLADAKTEVGFVADFRHLFKGREDLRRWIAISALTSFPMALF